VQGGAEQLFNDKMYAIEQQRSHVIVSYCLYCPPFHYDLHNTELRTPVLARSRLNHLLMV